jgi:Kdo2-lipid IVA lauroyltransferase/acyltransferase
MKQYLFYIFIRTITFPLSLLPLSLIHVIGNFFGIICYYCHKNFRKRALSNLSLACDLNLSPRDIIKTAKLSFQNLAITILEYPYFARKNNISKVLICENPDYANSLHRQGQGIIFFCGHQSNWEVSFIEGNQHLKGIAIGRPIKNKLLYQWIVSIREKTGGRIIEPKKALREGLKALKSGDFMGIVGDQGMPSSSYSFPFFGRRAWTSTAPALLSYKTKCPIIVVTTRREKGKYFITYSPPIYPDTTLAPEKEATALMDKTLTLLQESIKKSPGEWLWQHNRWKQHTPDKIYKRFRKDSICIMLPRENFNLYYKILPLIKKIYHSAFIFLFLPEEYNGYDIIENDAVYYYKEYNELFLKDYRYKLIFNFTPIRSISRYYKKLSAFEVLQVSDLKKLAKNKLRDDEMEDLSKVLLSSLCREGITYK